MKLGIVTSVSYMITKKLKEIGFEEKKYFFFKGGTLPIFLNSGVQQHTDFTVTIAFCSMQRHAACTAVSQIHGTVLQKQVTVSGSLIKVKQGLITCLF